MNTLLWVIIGGFGAFMSLVFWNKQKRAQSLRLLDRQLPAALLSAASFSPASSLELVLESIETTSKPPLSDAMRFLRKQILAGQTLNTAFFQLRKKYPSDLLARASILWEAAYRSGAPLVSAYKAMADDAYSTQTLNEERRAVFVLQKYTLFAGAVLVPLVLGTLFSRAPAFGLSATVFVGLHVYLLAFSVFCALFIAAVERRKSSVGVNALLIAMVTVTVFYAAAGKLSPLLF